MAKKKLMVIGWDAADWKVIDRLIVEGKMPALQKFLGEGVHGKIKTLDPPLSPMLWTSIATGFRSDKHGIMGFIEPTPDGTGLRPVTCTSRKTKAVWNILNQNGYKSNVVSWWPSNPAEPINGCMVSNLFQVSNKDEENWEMPKGTVHPERLADTLANYRVHVSEITAAIIKPFFPNVEDFNAEEKMEMFGKVAKIIAEMSGVHAASTYLQENEEWDFMAVYHDAIDHFSHLAMKFYPPRRSFVPEEQYNKFNNVVEAGYMLQDMMLERTLSMLDDDVAVMIVSDHGFHCDHLRPAQLPKEMAAPAREHNPYGIFCMKGPGIKKAGVVKGVSIIDVTPTILAYYDLPVGEDMEGKVLYDIFENVPERKTVPSWENISGDTGQHRAVDIENTWESQEAMKQLIELGYVDEIGDDMENRIEQLRYEGKYYVARNLLDGNRVADAVEILEPLYAETKEVRYGQRLALAYLQNEENNKSIKLVSELREALKKREEDKVWEKEDEKIKKRFYNPDLEVPRYLDMVEGMNYLRTGRAKKAIPFFDKVIEEDKASTMASLFKGRALVNLSEWEQAKEPLIQALAVNDLNPTAHFNLALCYLRTDDISNAIEEFLAAIELDHIKPAYHYYFGEALYKAEEYEHSVSAFKMAISLSPGMTKAHKWLIKIYKDDLNQPELALEHEAFINENIKEEIVVVSGLPRSGTSMMMQMLDAGGIKILSDGKREADISNPKGYYEYEKVKGLFKDNSWLGEAEGMAVKIITQLVPSLSPKHNYKIVYMDRAISEVLVSQQKMIGKEKDVQSGVFPAKLDAIFKKQVAKMKDWVGSQPNVSMIKIDYSDVIENPIDNAMKVASFLEKELDIDAMIKVVDPSLHRNKLA